MLRRKASEAKALAKSKAKQYIDALDGPVLDPPTSSANAPAGAAAKDYLSPAISPHSAAPYQAILDTLDEMQHFVEQSQKKPHGEPVDEPVDEPVEPVDETPYELSEPEGVETAFAPTLPARSDVPRGEPQPEGQHEDRKAPEQPLVGDLASSVLPASPTAPTSPHSPRRGLFRDTYDPRSGNSTASSTAASFPMVDVAYFRKLPPLLVDLGAAPEPPREAHRDTSHVDSQLESLNWKKPHKDADELPQPAPAARGPARDPLRDPREIKREATRDAVRVGAVAAKSTPQPIPKPVTLAQNPESIVSPVRLLDQPSIAQLVEESRARAAPAIPATAASRSPTAPLSVQTRVTPHVPAQASARTPTRATVPTCTPARSPLRVTTNTANAPAAGAINVRGSPATPTFYGRFPF